MKIGWRDAISTLLVAAIVVPYLGYLAWGSMPFIQDPTGMAGVAVVLGLLAFGAGSWLDLAAGTVYRWTIGLAATATFVVGMLALVSESFLSGTVREYLLGATVAAIVALWGTTELHHAGVIAGGSQPTSGAAHA